MAKYIEREVLLAWFGDYKANDPHEYLPPQHIIDDIAEIPVAEVVSVVHGRWEHLEQGWIDLWRCSACGDEWTFEYDPTDSGTKVNYCPNCGAHMKDGAEC